MILKVSSLLENGKDVTSFLGTVNDSSCSLAVADVHDLNILRRKFFCKLLKVEITQLLKKSPNTGRNASASNPEYRPSYQPILC